MKSALSSFRILDFSWVLAGPFATRLLADFGAEVIKVQPLVPDDEDKFSRGYYNTWNRNKLSITLNLDRPEGIDIAERLIRICDAIVENFSPRVMANFGLDYPKIKRLKPDIIMVSLSAMGNAGAKRNYIGFGPTVHAFSGMTYLTSFPGRPPMGPGFSYADQIAGLYASLALLAALEHRCKTGEGQYIDISQVEAMASVLPEAILEYTVRGKEPQSQGNTSKAAAPGGVYPCKGKDRWCAISVFNQKEWKGFKRACAHPDWVERTQFVTPSSRLRNSVELDKMISLWTLQHTAKDVMRLMQSEGVHAGVVQNAADLANDPQLASRGFFLGLSHTALSENISDAQPVKLSSSKARYYRPAPVAGEDNKYVYGKLLGMSKREMDELSSLGVI